MKKKLDMLETEVASQKKQNAKLVNRINDLESKIRLNDFDDRCVPESFRLITLNVWFPFAAWLGHERSRESI